MTTTPAPRRHDLDGLRAGAMLLGIALHAALAYAPFPWIAMNRETSPALGTFIETVHAFRLPLFFLMSGYFSMMLINRRGVGGFLRHRWKRIGLPLLLGTATIVPAMWGVIIGGSALTRIHPPPARERVFAPTPQSPETETPETIWSAAASGDLETVRSLLTSGASANEPDPMMFTLPLAWAATGDHAEITALLLESGADPNRTMPDGSTPLHTACFFGAQHSASLMLDAGADTTTRNSYGDTPIGSMQHGPGTVEYIANLLGVEADFERVEQGRAAIQEKLNAQGTQPETGIAASNTRGPLNAFITWTLRGELFMHLWFLWHLCWLAGGLALVTLTLRRLPRLRIPERFTATPLCLALLIPLTALTQSWQSGFGPDTSASLVPAPHVLAHYAVFFGFGALMFTSHNAADRLGRTWWVHLPAALATGVIALRLTHDASAFTTLGIDADTAARLTPLAQASFVWTTSFALVGLARLMLSRGDRRVRFLSDASYWLYLTHLPIVLAGQFALAYVPLPPALEFAALTLGTTALLLLVYHRAVRHTWMGRLLNGPRTAAERSAPRAATVTSNESHLVTPAEIPGTT